jgi:hypothetical protein
MLIQHNLLLVEGNRLQGFLPFRPSHRDARLLQIGVCIYLSTISVRPVARGRGLACQLYQNRFELPETLPEWVLLRTWSTNTHHLKLLDTSDLIFSSLFLTIEIRASTPFISGAKGNHMAQSHFFLGLISDPWVRANRVDRSQQIHVIRNGCCYIRVTGAIRTIISKGIGDPRDLVVAR